MAQRCFGGWQKLAGILLEGAHHFGEERQAVAIGIGVNVKVAPLIAGSAVSLAELGFTLDRREVFRHLSNIMSRWITTFAKGQGFYAVRQAWAERARARHPHFRQAAARGKLQAASPALMSAVG